MHKFEVSGLLTIYIDINCVHFIVYKVISAVLK